MNFTRDPIIETVITPREGCKLAIRSSKGANQEDYLVDAIEVVSFGHSFFYRSIERPKAFLVPISDYEVFETKEPKLALKNAPHERSIKIGGGKEPSKKSEEVTEPQEKKTKKRKSRKSKERAETSKDDKQETLESVVSPVEVPLKLEAKEPTSFISKLFPPPSMLIRDTIEKYKSEIAPEDFFQIEESETSLEVDLARSEDEEASKNEE